MGGKSEPTLEGTKEAPKESSAVESLTGHVTAAVGWLRLTLQGALCHVFQRFALEGDEGNREMIRKVRASLEIVVRIW